MKKSYLLISVLFTLILTSCANKVDVDKLSIAAAIGIDKSENGFRVTTQVVNASSLRENARNQPTVVVYSEEAKTVSEAIRKLTTKYPSRIFLSHFDIVFFGEEAARSGILSPSIFLYTDSESRHKYKIAVVKGATAEDVLRIKTPLSTVPAAEINSMLLSTGKIYGVSSEHYMDEIITGIKATGFNVALCTVEIIGDVEKGAENKNIETLDIKNYVKYSNLSVLKDDKLVGFLTMDEAQGYSHLSDSITSSVISLDIDDETTVAFEIDTTKIKIDFKIENDMPVFTVDYEVNGIMNSISTGETSISKQQKKAIENEASNIIKDKMERCIEKSKELESDIIGFGEMIHKKNYKYWKTIENDYDTVYKEMQIKINVKVSLYGRGY